MRIEGPVGTVWRISRRYVPTASQASGAILWALRVPNAATTTVQLLRAKLSLLQVAAPTAAIEDRFSLTVYRGYTAGDFTGGANVAPTGGKNELTASGGAPVCTVFETNVAGGLTGGTKVADGSPLVMGSVWVPIALQTTPIQAPTVVFDYLPNFSSEQPLTLATQKGFGITCDNALGTASGIILLLDLMWGER